MVPEVFFSATPNGWKVSIALEEIKAAGVDVDWVVRPLQLTGDQFSEWFTAVSPTATKATLSPP